ncbi:MAG: hypothetical protein QOJ26_410 [Thermoplasmata archaeon]|nr:hypothetical protein [Thermoplasmata archaeon]MEA3165553.1 hypothetical protein [Thermoplasmata archaeon]
MVAALLVAGLAGCAGDAYDVEVRSGDTVEQGGERAVLPDATGSAEGRGGLVGVVVDEAVRPIAGATVWLPTPDLVLQEAT